MGRPRDGFLKKNLVIRLAGCAGGALPLPLPIFVPEAASQIEDFDPDPGGIFWKAQYPEDNIFCFLKASLLVYVL